MENAIVKKSFKFNSVKIRTAIIDGEPWFVAKDVCDVLGIANPRNATARIPDKDKGVRQMDTLGGVQNISMISEAGLYRLVLRSDKPEAEPFIDWITSKLKPTIENLKEKAVMENLPMNQNNFGMNRTMSSREIAELTGKLHKNIIQDIKNLIEQGAIDRLKVQPISYKDAYGREQPEYLLDFDATMTLVTGYNAVLRAKVIRRWRELEEKNHSVALPKTYKEALKALLVEVEAREQLEVQNAQLTAREAENQPKVDFYEAVKKSESTCLVRVLARYLKQNGYDTGQNRLYAWMKNNGYIHKGGRSKNLPTQKSMNAGLFKVKMTEQELPNGDKIVQHTTLVTTKGVQYFVKRLLGKEYDGSITELRAKENNDTENVQNAICIEDLTWED